MFRNKVIFSVYQSSLDEGTNFINSQTVSALMTMEGIKFHQVFGVYKNSKELSFVVDSDLIRLARHYGTKYNQESILVIDDKLNTELEFLPLSIIPNLELGIFREVPESFAKLKDSYTYDPSNQKYYVTVKEEREVERVSFDTRTWKVS
jgi:hypothetical protein